MKIYVWPYWAIGFFNAVLAGFFAGINDWLFAGLTVFAAMSGVVQGIYWRKERDAIMARWRAKDEEWERKWRWGSE